MELGQADSHHLLPIYIICKNVSEKKVKKKKKPNAAATFFSVVVDGEAGPFWDNCIST